MKHFAEDELIAYQMHESADPEAIARHLESCPACAALAESIAETLRVFSAEPVPQVNVEHAWQRLRGGLPVLALPVRRPVWNRWLVWALPALALMLLAALAWHVRPARVPATTYANHRAGPLTEQPAGPAGMDAQAMNSHIDSAERLLTEVNHASGPLDGGVRAQAHELLLSNAVYVQQARVQGDLAQASLLEDVGRVLTTLDHEPERDRGWHLRLEMNTDGLLLDLRILQQNDSHQIEQHPKDRP